MTLADDTTTQLLALAAEGQPRPAIAFALGLLADGNTPERLILDLLAPVQRQVGALWAANEWSVADEHAASGVIDGVLGALALETTVGGAQRGEVLVACAEGEYHTLPARMGVEVLRADGWSVTFLGASLPADDLQRFAAEREPEAVLVSCTVPVFLTGARRCFAAVAAVGVPTLAVGAAFGQGGDRARRLGARGWLGPATTLAAVLDHGVEPLAPTVSVPPEAVALELDAEALEAACLSLIAERIPAMASYTATQLRSAHAEVSDLLGYLRTAVDLDEDQVFEDHLAWLSAIHDRREVPPSVLTRSVQCVGEVLQGAAMAQAARLCAAHQGAPTSC